MTVTPDFPSTLRVRDAADLLALVPHLVGHEPSNCSVLFFPTAEGRALCLGVDTPAPEQDRGELANDLLEALLLVPHCGDVAVVVYSDAEPAADAPCTSRAPALWEDVLSHLGLEPLCLLVVGPTHWWDAADPERAVSLGRVRDSPLNAELVSRGSAREPAALRDDPAWHTRLSDRGSDLLRLAAARGSRSQPGPGRAGGAAASSQRRGPGPGSGASEGAAVRPHPRCRDTTPALPTGLLAWARAVELVCADREHWVDAVLGLSSLELLQMLEALQDDLVRDALLYSWLCGSTPRAAVALEGLRAAMAHLTPGDHARPEPPAPVVEEALRCVAAVSGEWEGPPDWDAVDGAHRVLQVLDGLLCNGRAVAPASGGGPDAEADGTPGARTARTAPALSTGAAAGHAGACTGGAGTDDGALAAVVAVLAQLEQYRGRSRTAMQLLATRLGPAERSVGRRCAVSDVRRRLHAQQVPWWCADPRTSWPGRHGWIRGAHD